MSYTVIVLLPNGRRQTVKVTPNLSNLQILEEVCNRNGLNPEEFELKHYNRKVDLTSTVRFSNIPNNAQLELVKASKNRSENVVNVGVQLESGDRLVNDFLPTTTIWEIINYWEIIRALILSSSVDKDLIPVCVYMRNEIAGVEELKRTTLRSLGLLGGKAMLRLFFRPSDVLKKQAYVEVPLPKISKSSIESDHPKTVPTLQKQLPKKQQSPFVSSNVSVVSDSTNAPENKSAANALPSPRIADKFQASTSIEKPQSSKEKKETRLSENMRTSKREKERKSTQSKNRANAQELRKWPSEENLVELGERQALLFSLDSIRTNSQEELPDEFFNLTLDDLKYLLYDLKRKRKELEEMPLQTRMLREAEIQRKMEKYRETVIRIMFPDRLVLQGLFINTEKVSDVMDFIRNYISDEISDFYLFTTPPKRVLQPNEQLCQASLVPKAVVHFGGMSGPGHPLKEEIRKKLSSPAAANRAASLSGSSCSQTT